MARIRKPPAGSQASPDLNALACQQLETAVYRPYGSFWFSATAETTVSSTGVWYKAAGTTTDNNLNDFSGVTALSASNRLRYDGVEARHIHAVVTFASKLATGVNQTLGYGVYHYDASSPSTSYSSGVLAHSVVQRQHSANDIGTGAVHFDVMIDKGDYFEFAVRNVTGTQNIEITNAYMFIMGMQTG